MNRPATATRRPQPALSREMRLLRASSRLIPMRNPATALRSELRERALKWADAKGLTFYESRGKWGPVVLFPNEGERHGNFLDTSFQEIQRYEDYAIRLRKPHQRRWCLPAERRETAKELDSSNSSDALLMNIFCHPLARGHQLLAHFGLREWHRPQFGVRCMLVGEARRSPTELDMTFGDAVSVEAKLTEPHFTRKPTGIVERYEDLKNVFDVNALRAADGSMENYQLIRNVLAAHALQRRFVLLHDERRRDLRAAWEAVMRAIRTPGLRARCCALTWQQIAQALPDELQQFLAEKYGIA